MLVELNVVEQRYRVVLEVLEDGLPVTEVAMRHGVSRQTVHTWVRRYREAGMAGLVDRSRRPPRCAHQISAEMERMVCDLRRHHPRWGPWRLVHELRRQGVAGIPGRTSIYRVLDRNQLIEPFARRRQRAVDRRWERSRPMELWQMDSNRCRTFLSQPGPHRARSDGGSPGAGQQLCAKAPISCCNCA